MAAYGVALVACLAALVHLSAAAKYTVGGSTGWAIPTTNSLYSSWAAKQTFNVGDALVFNFQTGSHTVAEVSKSDYDACTTTNPITTITTGPATVTLSTAGAHYYICTVTGHCSIGQKLAITAAASPKSSPAPAPSKTPVASPNSSPASAPSKTPVSSPSASPATAPPPSSGAPVTAPSPAPTTAATPTSSPAPAPSSAATPTSAPVPAPSSGDSSPATSPASGATSTAPSTEATPSGGPSSGTTPSPPSSGAAAAAAAAGPVLSILLIGAAFLL